MTMERTDVAYLHAIVDGLAVDDGEVVSVTEDDWAPIGLADIAAAMRTGDYQQITPTVLAVEGTSPLFYPERINSLFGESGGGKTWVALAAVAEVVRAGGRALVLDYEDTPAGMAERLVLLGLSDSEIALVDYRNPTTSMTLGTEYFENHPLTAEYALIVLDSTGEAMAAGGINSNDDVETAIWFGKVKPLLRLPGKPAVVVLDHVPKDRDAPSSYAIGSQRKRAAVTGAAYRVDTLKEFAKGRSGKLKLTVAKDRPGTRPKGTTAAIVDIEAYDGGALTIRLHLSDAQVAAEAGERWRPTIYMERISRWLEFHPDASKRAIRDGVTGKSDVLDQALEMLIEEGFIAAESGPRGAQKHTLTHPFSEATDLEPPVDKSTDNSPRDRVPTVTHRAPSHGPSDPATVPPPLLEGHGGGARSTPQPVDNYGLTVPLTFDYPDDDF